MQYQRHNFAHNFLNAVETDKRTAWDILVNELNEVILDFPKEVEQAIVKAGYRLPSKASAKDKLDLIHDHIYRDENLRKSLLRIVAKRHTDPHLNADGGDYDQVIENPDFNMAGDAISQDEGTLNFVFEGAKRLVGNVKDKVGTAANKLQAADNLAAKEKQRNLPVSRSKGTLSTGAIVGISIAAATVIGLAIYMVYRSNKAQTE